MHWILGPDGSYSLVVKPPRGKGTIDEIGPGLRVLEYIMPRDPTGEWTLSVINQDLHQSHNFHPVNWDDDPEEELIIAAKEGSWHFDRGGEKRQPWEATQLTKNFSDETRDSKLPNYRLRRAHARQYYRSLRRA